MDSRSLAALSVRLIAPNEESAWNELMATHHYLGFERLVGQALKYVAEVEGQWVALIGWGTAAFKCASRDQWIGWSPEQQWRRLKFIANNQRFLVLPHAHLPNLASKTLALNLRRLSVDWQAIFGHPVVLAETFVDHHRFHGTCYRAANWLPLGTTRGFGRNGGRYYHHGHPKTVWVRPLVRNARALLAAPFLPRALQQKEEVPLDLNTANINGPDGLLDRLMQLKDPRQRRGIRHQQASILAVAICAVLSGARNFVAIGEWAAQLSQDLLARLNCRYHLQKQRFIAPSEATIRRYLQAIDPQEIDRIVGDWLMDQSRGDAIAVDGKTLRGSGSSEATPVHLMAALVHKEGTVVAQQAVDTKTNEIKVFEPLLDPLPLEGKVVTADAMHAQTSHARYLVEEKKADYLFTVKGNQPTLLDDIASLEESDFSPSVHRKRPRTRSH